MLRVSKPLQHAIADVSCRNTAPEVVRAIIQTMGQMYDNGIMHGWDYSKSLVVQVNFVQQSDMLPKRRMLIQVGESHPPLEFSK